MALSVPAQELWPEETTARDMLASEVATLRHLKQNSSIPVPAVYHCRREAESYETVRPYHSPTLANSFWQDRFFVRGRRLFHSEAMFLTWLPVS
ncbi:conserved hypothetical protein [Histoplasma capsulatum var. duboisii H88]|uniref:Uncharacterized protein n=1 Tax=Ajellomyces capsulatus (strain H88) TaxID=544711 RepID=F0UC15_AJEC8|nr:conserved hypothetical protein [Histoplasma capsulatum var. duboisii H88]